MHSDSPRGLTWDDVYERSSIIENADLEDVERKIAMLVYAWETDARLFAAGWR